MMLSKNGNNKNEAQVESETQDNARGVVSRVGSAKVGVEINVRNDQ